MKYEFHPEAEFEVIEAAAHYEREVPGLGVRFGDEVERVIDLLIKNPKLGAPIQEDIRHFVLRQFPFSVIYAEVGDILWLSYVSCGQGYRPV
jgi:plasmid stabilization system protein ParE